MLGKKREKKETGIKYLENSRTEREKGLRIWDWKPTQNPTSVAFSKTRPCPKRQSPIQYPFPSVVMGNNALFPRRGEHTQKKVSIIFHNGCCIHILPFPSEHS